MDIHLNPQVDMNISGGIPDIYGYLKDYTTIVLQPNKVGNRNILTQDMVMGQNVKYIIKYNYDLNSRNITFFSDVIVEIDGGSLKNGGIMGTDTMLVNRNELPENEILVNVVKSGTWKETTTDLVNENLADRSYVAGNGMGRIILKKDVPFGEQLTQTNTVYVIQYDFVLDSDVTIPENCVLEFDGGSLNNGSITFNKTRLENCVKGFKNVSISGSIVEENICTNWFDVDNTNTADVDVLISNMTNLTRNKKAVKVYFDKVYHTKRTLLIEGVNTLEVYGPGGLYKYGETYEGDNIALYIYDAEIIKIDGLDITIDTINRRFAENPSRFYCIWCRPEHKGIKQCTIQNCHFVDNNSVINSSIKPYNGTIWIGGYNYISYNISILNNVFENSCGRIVYCTNSENVVVSKNRIENAGLVTYTPDSNAMEVIAFRLIGCVNNIVSDNIIRFSSNDIPSLLSKVINICTNDNTYHNRSLNSIVSKNIIDVSQTINGNYAIINLNTAEDLHVYDNTIILAPNSDNRCYVAYYNGNSDDNDWMRKVFIKRNTILNANDRIFYIYGQDTIQNPPNNVVITENTISIKSNNAFEQFIPILNGGNGSLITIVNNTIIGEDGGEVNIDGRNFYTSGFSDNREVNPKLGTVYNNTQINLLEVFTRFGWQTLSTPIGFDGYKNGETVSTWHKVASVELGGEADFILCARNYANAGSCWIGVSILNFSSGEYQDINIVTLAKHNKNFSVQVKYKKNLEGTIDVYALFGGTDAKQSILPIAFYKTTFGFDNVTPPDDAVDYII